jgi:hypothetical protein
MAERKSVSTRRRFEIFKRDGFTCQYCGKRPPNTVLHLDHIIPVSKGGDNKTENLITACVDCNLGKSNILLDNSQESLNHITERKNEAAKQLREYIKSCKEERKVKSLIVDEIESIFTAQFDLIFTEASRQSVLRFHERLSLAELIQAMEIAVSRIDDGNDCFKYFCGICHNKMKIK